MNNLYAMRNNERKQSIPLNLHDLTRALSGLLQSGVSLAPHDGFSCARDLPSAASILHEGDPDQVEEEGKEDAEHCEAGEDDAECVGAERHAADDCGEHNEPRQRSQQMEIQSNRSQRCW
jgi:hypothetical protein